VTYLLTFACYGSWLHGDPRWARHGGTARLSDRQAIHDAVRDVIEGQGAPRCWYLHPDG